ncbi:hypothetical protein DM47_3711 [Burkholderia mallei]|nr:hypothetical protein DM47_3711 [Burkholderia mallei]
MGHSKRSCGGIWVCIGGATLGAKSGIVTDASNPHRGLDFPFYTVS